MKSEYENQLERRIDAAMKRLPILAAPSTLGPRVLAAIAARQKLPWYRTSWGVWPVGLQAATMVVLLTGFGGLCLATWQLTQAAGYTLALEEVKSLFAGVGVIWSAVQVLFGALVLIVRKLGTGFIIGLTVAFALAYAMCIGAGTIFFRLAFARNPRTPS